MRKIPFFSMIIVLCLFFVVRLSPQETLQQLLATDLFLAIEQRNTETAVELLSYGASVDSRDENGYTPLMYAVAVNDVKLAKLLIIRGAKTKLKSNAGKTALDYAKKLKRSMLIRIIGQPDRIAQMLSTLNDDIDKIKEGVQKNLRINLRKELQVTWQQKRRYRLKLMQQRLRNLAKFEQELKLLEEEQLLLPHLNRHKKRRIALLKKIVSKTYADIRTFMLRDKREANRRALIRIQRLRELQRKLDLARRMRLTRLRERDKHAQERLRRLRRSSRILYNDVRKAGSKYRKLLFKHVLSYIPSKYDRQRFIRFFDKGAEKILPVGNVTADMVIRKARRYMGQAYVFGGLDCSALWQRAFRQCGVTFPRTAELQARYGRILGGLHGLKRGDFIFFTRTYRTYWFVSHIAIYLGNNKILHAAKGGVQITAFPNPGHWWRKYYVFATRIWE